MKRVFFNQPNEILVDNIDNEISDYNIIVANCITDGTHYKCGAIHTLHRTETYKPYRYGWQRLGISLRYSDCDSTSIKDCIKKMKETSPHAEFFIFDTIYEFADWLKTA